MRKILMMITAVLILSSPSYAGSLIDRSKIRMPDIDDMNMGAKVLPNYTGTGVFIDTDDTKDYNLQRMKQMNPDFTTYPESHG
ncbi:MAG: hypothetical protein II964_05360, partial [Synergistaceae bacterium]|nr:hypothetical protein [Synergistaceae bacterium]